MFYLCFADDEGDQTFIRPERGGETGVSFFPTL
jgi:hypothetical protein